jgi:hypothetical protein
VLGALAAQLVFEQRRLGHDRLAAGVLAVERAERIGLGSAVALLAQALGVGPDERRDLLAIRGSARLVAHGVDEQPHTRRWYAARLEEAPQQHDELRVGRRLGRAE